MSNRTLEHVAPVLGRTAGPPPDAVARPELEALLSVLFMQMDEAQSLVLHVTSAMPGEGTTTVARDIAIGAAAAGWCSVALIDARPDGAGGGAGWAGLVESIERGEPLSLRRTRIGATPIDTAVLSTSGQGVSRLDCVRALYAVLRKRYSLVVVDCPAVFGGQQMMVLASAADETIMVLEAERSKLAEVARAREALDKRGASIMGVVLNKSRRRIPRLLGRLL